MVTEARKQGVTKPGGRQAFWRSRIGRRLLLSILLFSALVTLAITAVDLYVDYQVGVLAIQKELDNIQAGYALPLGDSLWNLDRELMAAQVHGIANLPDIADVEVREIGTADGSAVSVVSSGQRLSGLAERRDIPLPCNCGGTLRIIGVLHVEATFGNLYKELYLTALTIFAIEGTKAFLTSAFILFVVHRLFTSPLLEFARTIRSTTVSSWPLRLRHPPAVLDEFDELVGAFNALGERLIQDITDMRRTEADLHRYKEQLEATVQERTAQFGTWQRL